MDMIFHMFFGLVISKILYGDYLFSVMVFSMLPDLIGTIYLQILHIKTSSKKSIRKFMHDWRNKSTFYGKIDKFLYRIAHSILGLVIISVISYFFFENFISLSILYLSHILIDVFTHDKEYSTRLFYPFSDILIQGKNWATNNLVFFSFWIPLLIFFLIQIIL
jgi:hypothetical protein